MKREVVTPRILDVPVWAVVLAAIVTAAIFTPDLHRRLVERQPSQQERFLLERGFAVRAVSDPVQCPEGIRRDATVTLGGPSMRVSVCCGPDAYRESGMECVVEAVDQ